MKSEYRYSRESQCYGKRGWRHRRHAKQAMKRAQTNGHYGLNIYKCPWCGLHHLGRRRKDHQ